MVDVNSVKKEWVGMPECVNQDQAPFKSVIVHFNTRENFVEFCKLMVENTVTLKTKSFRFGNPPKPLKNKYRYVHES